MNCLVLLAQLLCRGCVFYHSPAAVRAAQKREAAVAVLPWCWAIKHVTGLESVGAWLLPLGPAASGHEDVLRGLWMSRDGASCGLGPLFPPLVLGSAGSVEAALPALCRWKTFKLWEMFPAWLCSPVQHCNRQELHLTWEFGTLGSALWHENVNAHSFSEQEQGHANVYHFQYNCLECLLLCCTESADIWGGKNTDLPACSKPSLHFAALNGKALASLQLFISWFIRLREEVTQVTACYLIERNVWW